jgi:hypothetical protein
LVFAILFVDGIFFHTMHPVQRISYSDQTVVTVQV